MALKKTPQKHLHLYLKLEGNAYEDMRKLDLQHNTCRIAMWQPYPMASQQKQCSHAVVRSWSLQVQLAGTSKGVWVSWRYLPPLRAPSPITEAKDMGLSPVLGWCSVLRHNLVNLRTCSEQCWEQKAGFEDASSCPTVCSSPGHMPSALSQAVWADMDLTHWNPPQARCSFATLTIALHAGSLLSSSRDPLPLTANTAVCWKRHVDKQSKL